MPDIRGSPNNLRGGRGRIFFLYNMKSSEKDVQIFVYSMKNNGRKKCLSEIINGGSPNIRHLKSRMFASQQRFFKSSKVAA